MGTGQRVLVVVVSPTSYVPPDREGDHAYLGYDRQRPPIAAVHNPRRGVQRPAEGNPHRLAQPRPDECHHLPASSSAGSNILSTVMSKNRAIANASGSDGR